MKKNRIVLNDLFDYPNRMLYQSLDGFKFSLDSILLAEFVQVNNKTKRILDLCTGNASIPLILSTKTRSNIDAFEIQEEIYDLAKKSVLYNKLDNQIKVYNDNIINIYNYKEINKYDIITCNPPYFKTNEESNINANYKLAIARHEITINLEEIFKIAADYLNDGGCFYLVHRATRIDEIIILANKYKINAKEVQFIRTKEESKPYIVLVKCVKGSKLGIKINKDKCIGGLKTYQNMFKEEV